MLLSLCYLLVRRVLDLAIWSLRSNNCKELEIAVLRHELAILRRHTKRPALTNVDRLFLAAASRFLTRKDWRAFILTPETLLRWHHRLVAKAGRLAVQSVDHQSAVRSETWSFVWLKRIPSGDIDGLSAS